MSHSGGEAGSLRCTSGAAAPQKNLPELRRIHMGTDRRMPGLDRSLVRCPSGFVDSLVGGVPLRAVLETHYQ
jgi:hypothetical protein